MATTPQHTNGRAPEPSAPPPPEPPPRSDPAPEAEHAAKGEEQNRPKPMALRTKVLLAAGVAAVVLGALLYYLHALGYEDTDDAEVDGNISSISPRVSGTVTRVLVEETQAVKAGDVLVELDPADLDVALAEARARVAQAQAEVEAEHPNVPITVTSNQASTSSAGSDLAASVASLAGARAEIAQLTAQLVQSRANDRTAQLEKARAEKLLETGATTQSDYDNRADTAAATAANVDATFHALSSAEAREKESLAKVEQARVHLDEVKTNAPRQEEARRASLATKLANLELAKAQLTQAELNRSYATVVAPVAGIIGKRTVNAGDRVQPGQELMALSDATDLWVTANFRETQLEKMHPGQRVALHVDALGKTFTGVVQNLGGATGSRYSVLPPENATGNYVKVVQRIGVRIRFDAGQDGMNRLRQGMSVEPKVTLK